MGVNCLIYAGDGSTTDGLLRTDRSYAQLGHGGYDADNTSQANTDPGNNGAITGEHGIGLAKKRWFKDAVSPVSVQVHESLKKTFDPNGILNPGKFI